MQMYRLSQCAKNEGFWPLRKARQWQRKFPNGLKLELFVQSATQFEFLIRCSSRKEMERIRANLKKTKSLADMQSPQTLKEMQSSGKLAALNRLLARLAEREQGLITFTDRINEITFKTPYKDPEMDDLTSKGHDLLSSKVILSEDDYGRGCERASDLESRFYMDVDKLDPSYKEETDRINLNGSFEVGRNRRSEVNNKEEVT
ncbi:hypothetical protein Tco_0931689 [Tanacetum coccineum]